MTMSQTPPYTLESMGSKPIHAIRSRPQPAPLPLQPSPGSVIHEVTQALRNEHPVDFAVVPCRFAFIDDRLEIDGEVPSIAIKRRALRSAAAHPAVGRVVDRLRVTPSCTMSDAMIAESVADALREEAALRECSIRQRVRGATEHVQQPSLVRGEICVTVEDRVVTLAGELPTHAHKRLAGVLAWWVPGTRDVIDELDVLSPDQDDDDGISDAVRTALEKDPFVDANQIRVWTNESRVTLAGLVWSRAERHAAENDAWSVFGVTDVDNAIFVAESA
jgi:osmotically-inducible protein OsmY